MNSIYDLASSGYGTHQFRYVVENYTSSVGDQAAAGDIRWSSHDEPGYVRCIQRAGHSYSAPKLTVVEWTTTQSRFEIAISMPYGLDPRHPISAALGTGPMRGGLVQVKIGLPGWSVGDYVVIYTGMIDDLVRRGYGNDWLLRLRSPVGLLLQRQTNTAAEMPLFWGFYADPPPSTTLTIAYSPGDVTVNVASTTGAARETGGNYAFRIVPSSGESFVLTATGLTATTFTGCSATAKLQGTAIAVSSGTTVELLYHIVDHPIDIFRKIACSTGLGTNNATYDTLPASWGLQVPTDLLHHNDMDNQKAATYTGSFRVADNVAVEDGLGFFGGFLNPAGFFLTEYQGLLSCRTVVNNLDQLVDGGVITDNDILSIDSYNTFNPDQMIEAGESRYQSGATLTVNDEEVVSRPARYSFLTDLPLIDASRATWHADIDVRIGPWALRVSEVVTLKVVGHRMALLGPGSQLYVYSKYISLRLPTSESIPWLVLLSEPNWFEGYTTLTLAYVPISEYSS